MSELDADFIISNNNALEAEYEISEGEHFDCSFEIYAAGTTWGSITGNIEEQTDLQDIFSDLQSNIDDVADDLSIEIDNRQSADTDLQDNIDTVDGKIDTHIADKSNPHEVTKAQIGLGNVDNTSDLNKPISTATQTALNGKQNTINDLSEIRTNASNGQSAYNTIQTYGDIVTYDASNFATSVQGQKADTALQPNDNISELNNDAGYITSASLPTVNNSTITFQKNNVTVGDINLNQPNNETINFNIPTTASDVNALPDTTTINDLTTTAQQNAIDSGANTTNIGQIATNTSNISNLSTTVTNNYNTLDGRITSEVSTLNTTIGTETTNRQNADNNLQSQIDAIVSSSDVFDIVGTYAELQAYDISTVPVNDIIKVLVDSTHSNAATYYRCVETGGVKSWSYIGSEGAYYTKSESDSLFVEQTTTVNGKALSTNITLTASDVGALPSSTTIGNGTLTIQNNSVDVDTFSANATSNKTINIVTPTKTSDLTNDSGYITGINSSDVITALGYTPYNSTNPNGYTSNVGTVTSVNNTQPDANGDVTLTIPTVNDGVLTITQNGTSKGTFSANQSINDTIALTDTTYNAFTGADGTNAGSSGLVPAPSATDNDKYLKGDGTWASVSGGSSTDVQINGTSITSGGVANILTESAYSSSNKIATMSDLPSGGANTDLSNLTATGEAHFAKIFIAEYGVTTYNEISTAYNAGKNIICIFQNVVNGKYYSSSFGITEVWSDDTTVYVFRIMRGDNTYFYNTDLIAHSDNTWSERNIGLQPAFQKVTSISSSSTDTQYPSAKLLYDQLALKQNTSTAVTHPASTAIGGVDVPVFVNSNGVVTSTGKSIASSRFDGQWVNNFFTITETSGTKNGVRFDLSSYLPNDSYKYDVKFKIFGYDDDSSYSYFINTDIFWMPSTSSELSYPYSHIYGGTYSRHNTNIFNLPVGMGRYIKLYGSGADTIRVYAFGYRRIGTNS